MPETPTTSTAPTTTGGGPGSAATLDVVDLLRRTASRWPLIAICTVMAALGGFVSTQVREKEYESTATLQLADSSTESLLLGTNLRQDAPTAQRAAATAAALVQRPSISRRASAALSGAVTPGAVSDAVSVVAGSDTNLVQIKARDTDRALAARIANATAAAFIAERTETSRARVEETRARVRAQLAALGRGSGTAAGRRDLQGRLRQLDALEALTGNSAEIVQPAARSLGPVSPRPRRDTALSALLGLVLGTVLAFLRVRLDTRVHRPDELREIWDLPLVALVADARELRSDGRAAAVGATFEAFVLARTNLKYLRVGSDVKALLVTSAVAGEGKSTFVWNLAVASALAGDRVLVIDADMRRPALSSTPPLNVGRGLAEILAGLAAYRDTVVAVEVGIRNEARVDVVPAGLVPPSPVTLLERFQGPSFLDEARSDYDLILVDSPPATVVADALTILPAVDAAVVVSRLGYVDRRDYGRLRDVLARHDTPVIAQVVNGAEATKGYGYYTGRTAPSAADRDAEPDVAD